MSMAKQGFWGLFSKQSEEPKEPYQGRVTFGKKVISFYGTTILLANVSQFEQYGVKRVYTITNAQLLVAIILAVGGLFFLPYGLLVTVPFSLIAYVGIKERLAPQLYGLTIQLNSGAAHTFYNTNRKSIEQLFNTITEAIEKGEPMNVTAEFKGNNIVFGNVDTMIGRDKIDISNASIGNVGGEGNTVNQGTHN